MSTLDLTINHSVRDADAYVISGGRYVLLAQSAAVTRVSTVAASNGLAKAVPNGPVDDIFIGDLNYGQLVGTPLQTVKLTGARWSVFDTPNELGFKAKRVDDKAGALYEVELSVQISGLTAQRTDQLYRLSENSLTAILADNNGRYWLLGYPQPLRVKTHQLGTNDNGYDLTLTGRQTVPPLEVSQDVVNAALTYPFTEGDTFAGGPQVNYNPPTGGGSSGPNYGPLTVVTPLDGHLVGPDEHVLILSPGYFLFLNETPTAGEFHIIKAKPGAEENPITLDGGPYHIDGQTEFRINSGKGSVTLIFSGSEWVVTAFADE
ncbi:hypothetical protein Q5H93_06265 [Hymenobacter sp. ASUV-10]|uniref:Major tail protein n=1 Tax=Hymenobacter aranciens TaxID=3063996 RepID=A0ABT9B953_9BACT|nr:hypothetical protein [Hymenobacter sp. ASUV-10]MDO7874330.1 hypothetical protein [Hymenobacter sp. ASUV-10]